jgi:hypothetical protein
MRRRRYLAALGTVGTLGLAGCRIPEEPEPTTTEPEPTTTQTPTTPSMIRNGSFEDALQHWSVGRDVPTDPNDGGPVETDVGVTSGDDPDAPPASVGERALSLFIDGRQDDGTLWVHQPVDLGGYDTLAFDVYSQQESFNVITRVAAYAGPSPPTQETDFDTTQAVEDHEGWRTYEYAVDHDGPGHVAVGVSVVWETEVTRYLDAVRLS